WSLPRMMGVECAPVAERFSLPKGALLTETPRPAARYVASAKGARSLAISPASNDAFRAAARAIGSQKSVRRAGAAIATEDGRRFPPGAFLVDAKDVPAGGGWLTDGLAIDVAAVADDAPLKPVWRVRAPRIGIYESFDPSMDKGWTTLVVERYL